MYSGLRQGLGTPRPFFSGAQGPLALAASLVKTYSISMTKQLFNLASRIRRAWVRKITEEIRQEEMQAVCVREEIISLNEEEASLVALEVRRLRRAQRVEAKRQKRKGFPPKPAPGKIAYAVYR